VNRAVRICGCFANARVLWDLWSVYTPSREERSAFKTALVDDKAVGHYNTPLGKRSSTLALAKHHLAQGRSALDAVAVRQGMYFSMELDGKTYEVPENLEPARNRWIVLQVRQLQRLALETLLSWCEQNILDGVRDVQILTTKAEKLFKKRYPDLQFDQGLAAIISELDERASTPDEFVGLGRSNPLFSPFALMDMIEGAFAESDVSIVAHCLYSLFVCASFAGCFSEHDRRLVSVGGSSRLSLYHLRQRLTALGQVSLKSAIQFVLEAMIISQHFATAVNRFDGRNQRLRLSIEEEGLTCLVDEPWAPTITEDRLPTILSLAADCGLIQKLDDKFL
jgi:hypothetical protein